MVTFDDFKKLDIKIGKIVSAEKISEGDKLLKIIFDFGAEQRQIMTAMAPFFPDPSVLVGKQMPVLLNIETKTFRGYESQGMIIAADVNDHPVFLLPEEEIPNGSIVK